MKRHPSPQTTKRLPPLPLNYIVSLENTFVDQDNINLVFEYLPGRDLYWLIKNQMNLGKLS
jgi:serine/threonine protein kinase